MFRIGQGFDIHRLETGRKLILGGVEIPYDKCTHCGLCIEKCPKKSIVKQ